MSTDTDAQLLQRRRRVMGGSPLFYDDPLHVVRGDGVYLHTADGRRFLDCYNNIPVVGHCNPKVVEAISRQARTLNVHSRYLSDNVIAYAERLLGTFRHRFDQVVFTCSGSEANEQALRIARMPGRGRGIICSNFAYHGNTAAVDQVSPLMHRVPQSFTEVRTVPFPETYRPLDGVADETLVERYLALIQTAIDSFNDAGVGFAGIIICPIFANEGLPRFPATLLPRLGNLVRKAGGLVIADEVQAGFGRTARMWGHELMQLIPDIVTMGKPMGNGYPIAALVSSASILDAWRERTFYFNTFAASQTATAAANAVLDVIEEENLVSQAQKTGDLIRGHFAQLAAQHPLIGDIRGEGLWVGVELVRDTVTKTPATRETMQLVNALKEAGVLVSRTGPFGNVLKIRPPLIFNEEHAAELMAAVGQAFRAVERMPPGEQHDIPVTDMSGPLITLGSR